MRVRLRGAARSAVDGVLRLPGVAPRLLARFSGEDGGLALLWHRVRPQGSARHEVIASVAVSAFEAQLEVLGELADIVPLEALANRSPRGRPRVALTFDDDDPGHHRWTLPLLQGRDLPATFFLSGRWRGAVGPYWWELLEERIAERGLPAVAAALGHGAVRSPAELAQLLYTSPVVDQLSREACDRPPPMSRHEARALADAGMEIGFHTRGHPVLTALPDAALRAAVNVGRDEVAADLATPVRRFAYPHGRHDDRVAAVTAAAGYLDAWTTVKQPVHEGDASMRLGRWDLSTQPIDRFRSRVVRALASRG